MVPEVPGTFFFFYLANHQNLPKMHPEEQLGEYEALIEEYEPILKRVTRNTRQIDLGNGKTMVNVLDITTLENVRYTVHLSTSGWTIVDSTKKNSVNRTYETSETLLMDNSPECAKRWMQILTNRLTRVAQRQQEEPDDETEAETEQ